MGKKCLTTYFGTKVYRLWESSGFPTQQLTSGSVGSVCAK